MKPIELPACEPSKYLGDFLASSHFNGCDSTTFLFWRMFLPSITERLICYQRGMENPKKSDEMKLKTWKLN